MWNAINKKNTKIRNDKYKKFTWFTFKGYVQSLSKVSLFFYKKIYEASIISMQNPKVKSDLKYEPQLGYHTKPRKKKTKQKKSFKL